MYIINIIKPKTNYIYILHLAITESKNIYVIVFHYYYYYQIHNLHIYITYLYKTISHLTLQYNTSTINIPLCIYYNMLNEYTKIILMTNKTYKINK
jgi:hypothetical protein